MVFNKISKKNELCLLPQCSTVALLYVHYAPENIHFAKPWKETNF